MIKAKVHLSDLDLEKVELSGPNDKGYVDIKYDGGKTLYIMLGEQTVRYGSTHWGNGSYSIVIECDNDKYLYKLHQLNKAVLKAVEGKNHKARVSGAIRTDDTIVFNYRESSITVYNDDGFLEDKSVPVGSLIRLIARLDYARVVGDTVFVRPRLKQVKIVREEVEEFGEPELDEPFEE